MESEIDVFVKSLGFARKELPQDGDCLFRAISECIYHTQTKHKLVRKEICEYLAKHKGEFKMYIEENFEKYVSNMRKNHIWGGQIEVECAARLYNSTIMVYSAKGVEAEHHPEFSNKIFLSYVNGNHYDVLYAQYFYEKLKISQNIVYDVLDGQCMNREYKNIDLEMWLTGADKEEKVEKHEIIQIPIHHVEGTWGQSNEINKVKDKDFKEKIVEKVVVEIPISLQEKKETSSPKPKVITNPNPKKVEEKKQAVVYPQVECKDFATLFNTYKKFHDLVILSNYGQTMGYVISKRKEPLSWTLVNCFGKTRHKKGESISLKELYEVFGKFLYSRLSQLKISEDDLDDVIYGDE